MYFVGSSQEQIQKELKFVLDMFREKRKTMDVVKTPEIYVDQHSTCREVQKWLLMKGFSEK